MNVIDKKSFRPSNLKGLAPGVDERVNVSDLLEIDDRVGQEIKQLRKARSMTLSELSDAANLSPGYLSQIERGLSSPSVNALHSISRALGVTISWFFSPPSNDDPELRDFVVRAGSRRKLNFATGITDELLSPNLGRQIELLICRFPPGTSSGNEPYEHHGEEAGVVLSGTLKLWVGDMMATLNEGDSFAFTSDTPHRYENAGLVETVVIWTITPPSY